MRQKKLKKKASVNFGSKTRNRLSPTKKLVEAACNDFKVNRLKLDQKPREIARQEGQTLLNVKCNLNADSAKECLLQESRTISTS